MGFKALNFSRQRSISRKAAKTLRKSGSEQEQRLPQSSYKDVRTSSLGLEIALRVASKATSWTVVITPTFLVFSRWPRCSLPLQLHSGLDNQPDHSHSSCKTNRLAAPGGEKTVLNIPEAPSLERYHDLTSGSLKKTKTKTETTVTKKPFISALVLI